MTHVTISNIQQSLLLVGHIFPRFVGGTQPDALPNLFENTAFVLKIVKLERQLIRPNKRSAGTEGSQQRPSRPWELNRGLACHVHYLVHHFIECRTESWLYSPTPTAACVFKRGQATRSYAGWGREMKRRSYSRRGLSRDSFHPTADLTGTPGAHGSMILKRHTNGRIEASVEGKCAWAAPPPL